MFVVGRIDITCRVRFKSIRGVTSVDFCLHFGSYLLVFERPVYENISYRAYGCQEDNNTDDNALWKNRTSETERPLAAFLELDAIKQIYLYGHKNPELISPDNWNMDFRFMERPSARQVQMDLFYDYRNNVALYPQWQKFLHERHPDTLIFWGQNDIFFTQEGGEVYLRDLPNAEIHRLNSGHFALEDCLEEISNSIVHFYESRVAKVLVRE
jgi:pimeloyl-ACP methyl ester carboxylesterase